MTTEVHIFQAKVILYAIFNILLAKALFDNFENKNLKIVILISLLISFLLFILNFNIDNLKYMLKHQLLGGTLPFVGILTFVFIKDRKVKIIIATLVLIMLYFIHSRASFYSFIVVYTFFILKELGVKKSIYIFFTILAISSILYFFNIIEPSKRMLGISQISQDGSFNERLEQFKYGIEAIKNNCFFGQYAGQVIFHEGSKYSAGLGSYMHNILSFYRQYGLVLFLIFSIYYLYLYLKIYLQFLKSDDEKIETSFYFGTLVLMYLLFFHAYDYPFIWFAFAFMNFVHLENKNKKYVKK
ncbi:O-antigen ligase family protein [Aliarcobacter butzleri]|uniref:O-antigen ligase family protein n=1 Tax=Aliarcobacter butzleri TaxID=28197 RepID=UPI001EDE49FC|nr:O-antigen ligase family protein [Aliarcobacter butzleri]MCG3674651.1 O-antigen ligase family protein [Aliarcobacter butzleri]